MELTNRNHIRGPVGWVSKHTFVKPLTNKLCLVDVAVINGRISVLPGEVLRVYFQEVSRGHSKPGHELARESQRSHQRTKGRTLGGPKFDQEVQTL